MSHLESILVVEDEALVREMIAFELHEAGFSVADAGSADEALVILDERPVSLLFTDIRMPGSMDGWCLAEEARARNPALHVIYASGYSDEQRLVADSIFLKKPYRPSEVLAAIDRLLA